jgi:hypothetical protein
LTSTILEHLVTHQPHHSFLSIAFFARNTLRLWCGSAAVSAIGADVTTSEQVVAGSIHLPLLAPVGASKQQGVPAQHVRSPESQVKDNNIQA